MSVLLLHSLSSSILDITYNTLHIGQAVPLFLFITFFLSFKGLHANEKEGLFRYYYSRKRISRVIKDVAVPFFLVVCVQKFINIIYADELFSFKDFCLRGWLGVGPGNYYFWVYIQLWVIIPILYWVLRKNKYIGVLVILAVSIFLNIIVYRCLPLASIYRLLAIRYLFLSVPAFVLFYLTLNNKKLFPFGVLFCILVSFVYLTIFKHTDLSPYVLDLGWKGEQWPAYFWTYIVFIFLTICWNKISNTSFSRIIEFLGRNSWYIFLAQMFLLAYFKINHLGFIGNEIIRSVCFVLIVVAVSLIPTLFIYLKQRKNEKSMYNSSEGRK